MSSSGSLLETALIAGVAATVSTWVVLQLTSKRSSNDEKEFYHQDGANKRPYPYPATFLQNQHTITEETEAARGWSMAESMERARQSSQKILTLTPSDILQSLQKGNSRFYTGKARRPETSAFERRTLINQQFPSTAILGCSDSRVPVEIVFDQGLGDMFVVRVAGNHLGPTTEASLEYAIHHLHVKVLLVMGHEGCGAIKAAGLPLEQIQQESKSLSNVLQDIRLGLDNNRLCQVIDPRARDREAVACNVRNQVEKLTQDDKIMEAVHDGKLIIVGAFYEISSGIVDFFMQVSQRLPRTPFKPASGVQSRFNPETKEIVYA